MPYEHRVESSMKSSSRRVVESSSRRVVESSSRLVSYSSSRLVVSYLSSRIRLVFARRRGVYSAVGRGTHGFFSRLAFFERGANVSPRAPSGPASGVGSVRWSTTEPADPRTVPAEVSRFAATFPPAAVHGRGVSYSIFEGVPLVPFRILEGAPRANTAAPTGSFAGSYAGTGTASRLQISDMTSSHLARIFIVARLSWLVHCKLHTTIAALFRGRVLAGGTFIDDPRTSESGAAAESATAAASTSWSRRSPNCTTTSRRSQPHASHARPVLCRWRP